MAASRIRRSLDADRWKMAASSFQAWNVHRWGTTRRVSKLLERKGEKRRGLSAHSPSPRARHPNPRLWPHERPRRCSMRGGEKWRIPSHNPQAEGYETEILANLAFRGPVNRVTCMRKPQALNALTMWVFARRLTAAKLHGTSPRWMIAEDKLGQNIATTKGNVTASWRQRNLRSGWRVRQYELTTWLRQRRRRFYMGSDIGHAVAVSDAFNAALSSPMKENRSCASKHLEKTLIVWFIFRNS